MWFMEGLSLTVQPHWAAKRSAFALKASPFWASVEDSILQNMQRILLESPYFSLNPKRLFLFEANTPEHWGR